MFDYTRPPDTPVSPQVRPHHACKRPPSRRQSVHARTEFGPPNGKGQRRGNWASRAACRSGAVHGAAESGTSGHRRSTRSVPHSPRALRARVSSSGGRVDQRGGNRRADHRRGRCDDLRSLVETPTTPPRHPAPVLHRPIPHPRHRFHSRLSGPVALEAGQMPRQGFATLRLLLRRSAHRPTRRQCGRRPGQHGRDRCRGHLGGHGLRRGRLRPRQHDRVGGLPTGRSHGCTFAGTGLRRDRSSDPCTFGRPGPRARDRNNRRHRRHHGHWGHRRHDRHDRYRGRDRHRTGQHHGRRGHRPGSESHLLLDAVPAAGAQWSGHRTRTQRQRSPAQPRAGSNRYAESIDNPQRQLRSFSPIAPAINNNGEPYRRVEFLPRAQN